jgi:hypothetical protein
MSNRLKRFWCKFWYGSHDYIVTGKVNVRDVLTEHEQELICMYGRDTIDELWDSIAGNERFFYVYDFFEFVEMTEESNVCIRCEKYIDANILLEWAIHKRCHIIIKNKERLDKAKEIIDRIKKA